MTAEVEDKQFQTILERSVLRCVGLDEIPIPIVALLSTDRVSQQFVALPAGPKTIIDSAAFHECWSTYLGLPSPACDPHAGRVFTDCRNIRRTLDKYGHAACRAMLKGDLWRKKHDAVKHTIANLAAWCRVSLDVEVANLFLPFIRDNRLYRDTPQRFLHGLVPDFRIVHTNTLADLKTFTFGPNWYGRARFTNGLRLDAVRHRADCVHRDCVAKLRRLDTLGGHDNDGPASRRLRSFGRVQGWAVGAFGEISPDLHRFIDKLSRRGAASRYRELGVDNPLLARPHIKRRCCAEIGIAIVRANAHHKLNALAAILMGRDASSQQAQRRQTASAAHRARSDAYYHQHSFHADDLPRDRRPGRF